MRSHQKEKAGCLSWGYFAFGKYLLARRVANKIVDLLVVTNANLYLENADFYKVLNPDGVTAKQKDTSRCPFVLQKQTL